MDEIYNTYSDQDFEAFFIITETNSGARATADFCHEIAEQYELADITVLYDDSGRFQALGFPPNHVHLVLQQGRMIFHRSQYRDDLFQPEIQALLED